MPNDNMYIELLKPYNQCGMMDGLETTSPKADKLPPFADNVRLYENKTHYRLVIEGVCGMLVDKETKTIQHIFTALFERQKGYAKGLIACAHIALGGVNHSENCTELGAKCFKKQCK